MEVATSAGEENFVAFGQEECGCCEGCVPDVDRGNGRIGRRVCRGGYMVKIKR